MAGPAAAACSTRWGAHIVHRPARHSEESELGRRLAGLYKGTFFERLLTRFSVPEVRCNRLAHLRGAQKPFSTQPWCPGLVSCLCLYHVMRNQRPCF